MTQYTQNYSLPYPEGNDAVAVHTDIEDLAKRVDLSLDIVSSSAAGLLNQVAESSKTWTSLARHTEKLEDLPEGRYVQATSNIASQALGYPVNERGLLFVDAWTGSGNNRILRYYAENGQAFVKSVSQGEAREWHELGVTPIYLTANDHLHDLREGIYKVAYTNFPFESLGYPESSRGIVHVFEYNYSGSNKMLTYRTESGKHYQQAIVGNSPQGWIEFVSRDGMVQYVHSAGSGSGPAINDTTPRLLVSTEAGHDYYKKSTEGTWAPNDESTKAVGKQSIRVTSDGSGANDTIIGVDNVGPFDLLETNPKFWIRVPDWSNVRRLEVRLGTDGMNDYYRWIFVRTSNRSQIEEGFWRQQTLNQLSVENTVGSPDPQRLTHIEIHSGDNGDGTFEYNLGPFYETPKSRAYPKGVVSLSFDDGRLDTYTTAKPIMDKYGFPGTAYVMAFNIGQEGRVTMDHLREMQDNSGWEIGGHTYAEGFHQDRLTSFTEAELDEDMRNFKEWQQEHGFHGTTYAYPGGTYNDLVKRVTLRHFKAGRAIHPIWETMPANDLGSLTVAEYVRYPDTTVSRVKRKIDEAIEYGMWLHICLHSVKDVSGNHLDYPTHMFEEICEYIYNSGVPVRTVEQVVDSFL